MLKELQNEFLDLVKGTDIEVISFVETECVKVTSLGIEIHCVPPNYGGNSTLKKVINTNICESGAVC